MMQIFYDDIEDGGLSLESSLAFTDGTEHYNIKSFSGNVDNAGDVYFLHGLITLNIVSVCDRCLSEVEIDIKQDIAVTLSPIGEYPKMKSEEEDGLSDEEAGMYVTDALSFDLHEILREEAILAAPAKKLCVKTCKGLCTGCGANLNEEPCNCVQNVNEKFSALAKLKNK